MSSVCLSICLSVTLVNCDHIGWNSSKIISPLVNMGCSLFATPTWRVCSKRNTPVFGPKVTHPPYLFERRRHSIANCGRMVADCATVTMESLWETTIGLSNGVIADPLRLPLPPKMGFRMAQHTRMASWPYLCNGWSDPLRVWFQGGVSGMADRTALFTVRTDPRWRPPPCWRKSKWPYLGNRSSDPLHVWL